MGVRYFFFHETGQVEKVSYAKFQRIFRAEESCPRFADKSIRYAHIDLILENRKPVSIGYTEFSTWYFDEHGYHRLDESKQLGSVLFENYARGNNDEGNLVDFRSRWAVNEKKRRDWTPSDEDLAGLRQFLPNLI